MAGHPSALHDSATGTACLAPWRAIPAPLTDLAAAASGSSPLGLTWRVHFMVYNFVKMHGTLRVSPAMAGGVTDHLWEIEDLVGLVEQIEAAGRHQLDAQSGEDQ